MLMPVIVVVVCGVACRYVYWMYAYKYIRPHRLHVIDLLLSVPRILSLYTYNIVSDVFGFISSFACLMLSVPSIFFGDLWVTLKLL